MIREWTVEDGNCAPGEDRLAIFMKAFEGVTEHVKVDPDYTSKRYMEMIGNGSAKVFIGEENGVIQGAIGFIISNDLHDGKKVAIEAFWFVDPTYRGLGKLLFNVFEEEGKKIGCEKFAMIHMVDSYPDTLEAFYIRNGYKLVEKHYVKEI